MKNKQKTFDIIWFSALLAINIVAYFYFDEIKSNPYHLGLFRGLIYPSIIYINIKALLSWKTQN